MTPRSRAVRESRGRRGSRGVITNEKPSLLALQISIIDSRWNCKTISSRSPALFHQSSPPHKISGQSPQSFGSGVVIRQDEIEARRTGISS